MHYTLYSGRKLFYLNPLGPDIEYNSEIYVTLKYTYLKYYGEYLNTDWYQNTLIIQSDRVLE